MVDELSEVIKLTNGLNSLTEDQLNNVKDQVWQSYVNNKLIAEQADECRSYQVVSPGYR